MTNIQKIETAAKALIANRAGIKQAQENGKGFTVELQHAYLQALKADDKAALDHVSSKVWKRGEEQGEYYGIRGVFSKVRTIFDAGLDVAPSESFDKAYKAAQENKPVSEKDVETAALKAFAEENGITLRDVRAMTISEQAQAFEQGKALLESKAKNAITFDETDLLSGMLALVDQAPEMAQSIIDQVTEALAAKVALAA